MRALLLGVMLLVMAACGRPVGEGSPEDAGSASLDSGPFDAGAGDAGPGDAGGCGDCDAGYSTCIVGCTSNCSSDSGENVYCYDHCSASCDGLLNSCRACVAGH